MMMREVTAECFQQNVYEQSLCKMVEQNEWNDRFKRLAGVESERRNMNRQPFPYFVSSYSKKAMYDVIPATERKKLKPKSVVRSGKTSDTRRNRDCIFTCE